jgi:hypothetical protein
MEIRAATPSDVPAVLPMVGKLATLHENWDPQRFDYRADVEKMYSGWLRARRRMSAACFWSPSARTKSLHF